MIQLLVVYAHWCPICNMMMPVVEELEEEHKDRLKVIKIDVDEQPDVYEIYGIQMIPTFIIYREREEIGRMSGLIGEEILKERVLQNEI